MPKPIATAGQRALGALAKYRAKRRAGATTEPFAAQPSAQALIHGASPFPRFVIQQHRARNLHFDLRLQFGWVLKSWAVPKGPSMDPADKRFAVLVEDHPLEYGDFEGTIPEGNYGAGHVIVWDSGTWHPLNDPEKGLESGKLLFELDGCKLRGRFTLVRMREKGARASAGKDEGKHWLFIKEQDALAGPRALPDNSIFSGLNIDALQSTPALVRKVHRKLIALKAPDWQGTRLIKPMLANSAERHDRDDWAYEIKFDGYRIVADKHADSGGVKHAGKSDHNWVDQIHLRSRNGLDLAEAFPELTLALRRMPWPDLIIDGEVVVHDLSGRPSFSLLQRRLAEGPQRSPLVRFHVFDILAFGGKDLRTQPLSTRKAFLKELLPQAGLICFVDHLKGNGFAAFDSARRLGLEGVMAKRLDSTYKSGRSDDWIKVRAERSGDFVILGYTLTKSRAQDLGALLLGQYQGNTLRFVGRVGTGFSQQQRESLLTNLKNLASTKASGTVPEHASRDAFWVDPKMVCEVRYREFTREGNLRLPVFARLRSDKSAVECRSNEDPEAAPPAKPETAPRVIALTNLEKLFWPVPGYRKSDLVNYYRKVAPWLLPYLHDRPLVMTRYPDGVDGKSFFQKDAPVFTPDWIRTEVLWSDGAEREVRYFVAEDADTLAYLANLGTIPLHIWSSRVASLAHPDWCILDLDPKEAPFAKVIAVAKATYQLMDELGLPSFLKTTGSSGLHILLPLAQQLTHDQARTFSELLAMEVVRRCEDIATLVRARAARQQKVYVDYLQNGHGKLLVAPFSARAVPGANISMPLPWSALNAKLSNARFDIANGIKHLQKYGDPMLPLLTVQPNLAEALARLADLTRKVTQ